MSRGPDDTPNQADPDAVVPHDAQTRAFVNGLIERGEAVEPPAPGGKLPPGATHVVIGKTDAGDPIVKRVRFSAF